MRLAASLKTSAECSTGSSHSLVFRCAFGFLLPLCLAPPTSPLPHSLTALFPPPSLAHSRSLSLSLAHSLSLSLVKSAGPHLRADFQVGVALVVVRLCGIAGSCVNWLCQVLPRLLFLHLHSSFSSSSFLFCPSRASMSPHPSDPTRGFSWRLHVMLLSFCCDAFT